MSLRPTLLAEIRETLGQAVSPSLTTESDISDLYEAYIFSIILQAARREGAEVVLSSIQGIAPSQFVFRTSPGYLNSSRHNYGFAELRFQESPPLEVHAGVRVAGRSNVLHECDVSVLDGTEAQLCRNSPQALAPRSSRIRIMVEAKYYMTPLALQLGRAFLGLVQDLSSKNSFFVFNREAESIERLLAHRNRQWDHHIVPANEVPVERLRSAFQVALKDYRARTRR